MTPIKKIRIRPIPAAVPSYKLLYFGIKRSSYPAIDGDDPHLVQDSGNYFPIPQVIKKLLPGNQQDLSMNAPFFSLQTIIALRGEYSSQKANNGFMSFESTRLLPLTSTATSPLPSIKSTSRPVFVN
jgi:hypothetical protein